MSKEEMVQCIENRTFQQTVSEDTHFILQHCHASEENLPGFSSNQGLEGAAAPVTEFQLQKLSVIILKACAAFDQSHAPLKTLPQILP